MISINNLFLHCHTISYQCTAIVVGLSNTLSTLSRHGTVQELAVFHQDSPYSRTLQHEASILKELDAVPPDEFRTELSDSLTAFFENILKKSGAGGRPAASMAECTQDTTRASITRAPGMYDSRHA